MSFYGILVLLLLVKYAHMDPDTYKAAVAEYHPIYLSNPDNFNKDVSPILNAVNYIEFIKRAEQQDVDIIVFPENGLSKPRERDGLLRDVERASYVPDPKDNIVICGDEKYNKALKMISCQAKDSKMYVVVNHPEKEDCPTPHCTSDGLLFYNTNIVFDREGKVIARYRKFNLFTEPGTNVTSEPELSIFNTDFGVTFGQFICFDLLFETPTLSYVREHNISNIIFSTHWFNEIPFLAASPTQAAWAYATNTNFLGAGYNNPKTGSGGSGIYAGILGAKGAFTSTKPYNVLIVANLTKIPDPNNPLDGIISQSFNMNDFMIDDPPKDAGVWNFYDDDELAPYSTELIDVKRNGKYEKVLCNNGMCCSFVLGTTVDNVIAATPDSAYYKYRLVAFSGIRGVGPPDSTMQRTFGIDTCGIISCLNDDLQSCNSRFKTTTNVVHPLTFDILSISMPITDWNHTVVLPIASSTKMLPIDGNVITFKSNDTESCIKLNWPNNDIMTFALYKRNFEKDGSPITKPPGGNGSGSSLQTMNIIVLLTIFCVIR